MAQNSLNESEDQLKKQFRLREEFDPSDGLQKNHGLLSVIRNITDKASFSEQGIVKKSGLKYNSALLYESGLLKG